MPSEIAWIAGGLVAAEATGVTNFSDGGTPNVPTPGGSGPNIQFPDLPDMAMPDLSAFADAFGANFAQQAAFGQSALQAQIEAFRQGAATGFSTEEVRALIDANAGGHSAEEIRAIIEENTPNVKTGDGTQFNPQTWLEENVPNFQGGNGGSGGGASGGRNVWDFLVEGPGDLGLGSTAGATVETSADIWNATLRAPRQVTDEAGGIIGTPGSGAKGENSLFGWVYGAGQATRAGADTAVDAVTRDPTKTLPGGFSVPNTGPLLPNFDPYNNDYDPGPVKSGGREGGDVRLAKRSEEKKQEAKRKEKRLEKRLTANL